MNKTLLFEIGTEEIPANFMTGIIAQVKSLAAEKLQKARIPFTTLQVYGTPRRIALLVQEVAETQERSTIESKGPSVKIAFDAEGNYTKAAQGFAKGQGINPGELENRGEYVYAVKQLAGQEVKELLPNFLLELVEALNFPKNMRWGDHDFRFIRPIRWLVTLWDDQIIPLKIAGVQAGNESQGHRFLSEGKAVIAQANEYEKTMRNHFVLINQDERKELIKNQVNELARQEGGIAEIDEDLLTEITFLVEFPTALCGYFDEKFLSLPKEAIITPMREHQRYFPVVQENGTLLNKFITVRNGGDHALDIVAHGNERVLRARLSDAEFFFNEDRRSTLESRLEKLKTVVFQDGLGNIYDKSLRLAEIATFLREELNVEVEKEALARAALLAKTDLVTGMVCEFTELQGIMGREYALREGELPEVAVGIYEHYLPRFAGDELPQGTIGSLISLADKLDNIVATFSRGLIPTGSQDPYALRRQAIGVINIMLANNYHFDFNKTLGKVLTLLNIAEVKRRELIGQVKDFFLQRVKNMMGEQNLRYDIIDAVLGVEEESDFADMFTRAHAVAAYLETAEAADSIQAFTRVVNISKKAGNEKLIKESLFVAEAEKELYAKVLHVQKTALPLLMVYDYGRVLELTNELKAPVNNFFDTVMVMDPDENVKNNRLALLLQVKETAEMVADLSKIVL